MNNQFNNHPKYNININNINNNSNLFQKNSNQKISNLNDL